jgi:hypothetical protein
MGSLARELHWAQQGTWQRRPGRPRLTRTAATPRPGRPSDTRLTADTATSRLTPQRRRFRADNWTRGSAAELIEQVSRCHQAEQLLTDSVGLMMTTPAVMMSLSLISNSRRTTM